MEKFYRFFKNLATIIGSAVLIYATSVVIVSAVHTAYYMIVG